MGGECIRFMAIAESGSITKTYGAPPIVEAVVEVRFSSPVARKKMDQATKRLTHFYAVRTDMKNRTVQFNVAAKVADFTDVGDIFKVSSAQESESATIGENSITFSQLAPYPGWDVFSARIYRDIESVKKILPFGSINRVGMRYINRIDLAAGLKQGFPSDFIQIKLGLPKAYGKNIVHAAIGCQFDIGDDPLRVILNTGFADSPIPGLKSMVLDLDIIAENRPPADVKGLFAILSEMRDLKNELFESSITETARKRFNP
jgi:uncharacterized protein (TIGR04255 family)